MQRTDRQVIDQLVEWLQRGIQPWLCTIVKTYGSAPRPAGSLFAFDGERRVGSISGGCLEDEFVSQLAAGQFTRRIQLHLYGESGHTSPELPCGGRIQLCIERLEAADLAWLQALEKHLQAGRACRRLVDIRSGETSIEAGAAAQPASLQANLLTLDCGSQWSLLLLGASPVAAEVARLGIACGYRVRVCELRDEFGGDWPLAEIPVERQLSSLFVQQYCDERTAVLALAHDPRVDDIGLMRALDGPAFYIGAMGSARTSQKRRERLQRSGGISAAQLQRLHAPVGLPIGSKTPPEIAIAIMADIIRCRAQLGAHGEEGILQSISKEPLCQSPQ